MNIRKFEYYEGDYDSACSSLVDLLVLMERDFDLDDKTIATMEVLKKVIYE